MSNNDFAVPNEKAEEAPDTTNTTVEGEKSDTAISELLPPEPPKISDSPEYHPRPDHFLQQDNPLENYIETISQYPNHAHQSHLPPAPGVSGYYQSMPTPEQKANDWQGVVSTVLSSVSVVFSFLLGIFVIPLAIAGVIFGHMGLHSAKRGTATNRALSLTGTIIGYCVVSVFALLIIGIIIIMIFLANSASPM